MKINTKVIANRDIPSRHIKKGEIGVVLNTIIIDSELYLVIELNDDDIIGPSCENCWNVYE